MLARVRDFVEQGGNVLLVIAGVSAVMWTLIYERLWYFQRGHRRDVARVMEQWAERADRSSWSAHQIRAMLVSETRLRLQRGVRPIHTIVKLCPMLGLLGTVIGMIEVFDVMAGGSGNARGMAAGVSKATLPTMAGMVAALSGMLFSTQISRYAAEEAERVADHLEIETELE